MSKRETDNRECPEKIKIRRSFSIDESKVEIIKEVAEKLEEILKEEKKNLSD